MVSELRKDPRFARVWAAEVYEDPTIGRLGGGLDAQRLQSPPAAAKGPTVEREEVRRREQRRHFITGMAQAISLYIVFGLRAALWITPYLVYFVLLRSEYSALESAAWAVASTIAVFPLVTVMVIAAKWILLGRVRPGRYPLWSGYYLRWWLVQALVRGLPLRYLSRTPLLPFVYRLFGAQIGKDVFLATDHLAAFDLIAIGEGTSVDDEASLTGFTVENGELVLGSVCVGRGCFIGIRSLVSEVSPMEDEARLEDLSLLERSMRIPRGETWTGSPAPRGHRARAATPPPPPRRALRRAATAVLYAALVPAIPILLL